MSVLRITTESGDTHDAALEPSTTITVESADGRLVLSEVVWVETVPVDDTEPEPEA